MTPATFAGLLAIVVGVLLTVDLVAIRPRQRRIGRPTGPMMRGVRGLDMTQEGVLVVVLLLVGVVMLANFSLGALVSGLIYLIQGRLK